MKIVTKIGLGFSILIAINACIGVWLYLSVAASDAAIHRAMEEAHEESVGAETLLKAEAAFGWRAVTPLEDGLRDTIAWYLAHRAEAEAPPH